MNLELSLSIINDQIYRVYRALQRTNCLAFIFLVLFCVFLYFEYKKNIK